ncbi:MAG: hypothetical protein NZ455_09320 [Bacteroidia bacterium]|nr:hypothetical protein [Bacteroidia bacterium]MDW8347760.1 hypothetical protein [Bacteroidia bacterium]
MGLLIIIQIFTGCTSKLLVTQATVQDCYFSDVAFKQDSLNKSHQKSKDTTGYAEVLKKRFSQNVLDISKDIDVYELLYEFAIAEKNGEKDKLYPIHSKIQQRISLAQLQVSSVLSELHCEVNRTLEAQKALDDWINKKNNQLTVYSIALGSITDLMGIISQGSAFVAARENTLTIITVTLATYYGVRTLLLRKKTVLEHSRNHIRDILDNPEKSKIYLPVVWNFLSKPYYDENKKLVTEIALIQKEWEKYGYPDDKKSKRYPSKIELLKSDRGGYTSDDLTVRVEMLKIIIQEISTINYDLEQLQHEVLLK